MSTRVRAEMVWQGLPELKRYLEKTIPKAYSRATIRTLRRAAYIAKAKAKQLVPVDTGSLRKSIRVERFAKTAGNITYTGIAAGGYIINPRTESLVDYAIYVEYGTSRARPQPFIRPAIAHAGRKIPDIFWDELAMELELTE